MAGPGGKRKRGDRVYSQDSSNNGSRPSPYSPENSNSGRQIREQDYRGNRQYGEQRGGGRGRRQNNRGHDGGRGRGGNRADDRNQRSLSADGNSMQSPTKASPIIPSAMSPPPLTNPKLPDTARRPSTPQESTSQQITFQQASPISITSSIPLQAMPDLESSFQDWEYLTNDRIASWRAHGRREVVEVGVEARLDEDPMALSVIFQEILRSGLDRRIDTADAGSVIREILGEQSGQSDSLSFDATTLFLDTLSIWVDSDVSTERSGPGGAENININPHYRTIIESTNISPVRMRSNLDRPLLIALGLARPSFNKSFTKVQTNLLYRQAKYNLLREESEGYSKLITELFTTSTEPPSNDAARESFERIKAFVGAFDLDVGRVLDVTLDVFASVLIKQFRFFVKLLRVSSWWPRESQIESDETFGQTFGTLPKWALPGSTAWLTTDEDRAELLNMKERRDREFWDRVREVQMGAYFEIGGRKIVAETRAMIDNGDLANALDVDDRIWIDATGTLPPRGNRVAASLLGFKLRFYASQARDPTDVLPPNLMFLTALLIKIGFISLRDLYPHLWPADEDMGKIRDEKIKEKIAKDRASRPGAGTMNALMMAGALPEDSAPAPGRLRETDGNRGAPAGRVDPATEKAEKTPIAATAEEKERLPEPKEQKVDLLKSLLCIGALPESLFILGRLPWIPDAYPEIVDHIHRILHHTLEKVYEPLRPMSDRVSIRQSKRIPDPDQSGVAKGETRLLDVPARKTLRWPHMDRDDTNEGIDYRFYWDDWADNVPVAQTIDDVFLLCSTLLSLSGVKIGRDASLLFKLARIGKNSWATDRSESNATRWIDLSKRLLVPALSLTKGNPGVVNEVFDLVKMFPTSTRYAIYAEWYHGAISRQPDIKAAFDLAKHETLHVLKRISKTNTKPMARALAKVAYASPGIVFRVALSQIESYDNLVDVVVECGRYFTHLGYDVLTWSLLGSLTGGGRDRVQMDGILVSKWLSALSLFAGKVFKRYSTMNPSPILQFVASQLAKGIDGDLVILREITSSMAGIVMSDTNINESQIQALSGGDVLRHQTLLQLHDKRQESRTTARRLMKSLTESRLVAKLLILIAQERRTGLYKKSDDVAKLKLVGNMFDETHRVLAQYLDLLRSNLSEKDFDSVVPGVTSLMLEYGIEPSIAFWISRPSIDHDMKEFDKEKSKAEAEKLSQSESEKAGGGASDQYGDAGSSTRPQDDQNSDDIHRDDAEMTDISPEGDLEMKNVTTSPGGSSPLNTAAAVNGITEPWHPVLKTLMNKINPILSEETWAILGVPFYVTFWQLSLYDISVPMDSYTQEENRAKGRIASLQNDRSDMSQAGVARRDKEKQMLIETQDRLHKEMRVHLDLYQVVVRRIKKEKNHWFAGLWGRWDALADAILEHCILPRAVLSPTDALFSFKFIKLLHSQGTPHFRTMGVIDHIFRDNRLANMIFVSSSREAENLGRFLKELLKNLDNWRVDKELYEKEAFGAKKDLPGFAKKLISESQVGEFLEYEDFRRILYKWHKNINVALKTCLTHGEYMHIQNAITIIKSIHPVFPAVNWMGEELFLHVSNLSENEKREDLKLAATAVKMMLQKDKNLKIWTPPNGFCIIMESRDGTGRASSARPTTPLPDPGAGKNLNAEAVDFKPKKLQISVGTGAAQSGRVDVEDGEIEDVKMKDAGALLQPPVLRATTEHTSSTRASRQSSPTRNASVSKSMANESNLQTSTTLQEPLPPRPESRPDTPSARKDESRPSIPFRPDLGKAATVTSASAARPQHSLPTRPDVPPARLSDRRIPDRPAERLAERPADRRDGRDHRFPEHGRLERPGDVPWDHGLDRRVPSPSRRAPPERVPERVVERGTERGPDRSQVGDRDRRDESWSGDNQRSGRNGLDDRFSRSVPRDDRPPSRNGEWNERLSNIARERLPEQQNDRRTPELPGRASRDPSMAPPRSTVPQHPDRAALIKGDLDRRSDYIPGRLDRDDRGVRAPRPQSPRRLDDPRDRDLNSRPENRPDTRLDNRSDHRSDTRSDSRSEMRPDHRSDHRGTNRIDTHPEARFDNRHDDRREERSSMNERKASIDFANAGRGRGDDSNPPSGPRGDRPNRSTVTDHQHQSFDRPRDGLVPNPPSSRLDPDHGRLSQDSNPPMRQHDPNYGRLNPGSEIPSGPRRNAAGRGGRAPSGAQAHINTRQAESSQQAPPLPSPSLQDTRHPPTGPSFGRAFNRPQAEHSTSAPSPAPPTPVPESLPNDMAGVHPERIKGWDAASGVHPERLKGWNRHQDPTPYSRPPPLKTDFPATTQNAPVQSPASSGTPSGPRGPNAAVMSQPMPSPTTRNPPTGPSSAGERSRDKRFAQLQNVLQQGGSPTADKNERGASIRGRATRSSAVNGPPMPTSLAMPLPPSNGRQDLFQGRIKGPSSTHGDEELSSGHGGRSRDSGRDGETRRSGRHRSSRSHSRDHDTGRREDDRQVKGEDHRERDRRGSTRDERGNRHSRDDGRERERRGEGREKERRDGREGRGPREMREPREDTDRREPGDNRRWGGGMERDDRERDTRKDGSSGRKRGRVGEDVMLERGSNDSKRPRRGH